MTHAYDVPGRGSWTLKGGFLPLTPVSTSKTGYLRAPQGVEKMIGSGWANGTLTYTNEVVFYAVQAYQKMVGASVDGLFGPDTQAATIAAQRTLGIQQDGIAGPGTLKALLRPILTGAAESRGLSVAALGGICFHESGGDLAAVGVNGADTGPLQYNMAAPAAAALTVKQATDPTFSALRAGDDMVTVMKRWRGKTSVALEIIGIANHNSPLWASQWAHTGTPPNAKIAAYVAATYAAWTE